MLCNYWKEKANGSLTEYLVPHHWMKSAWFCWFIILLEAEDRLQLVILETSKQEESELTLRPQLLIMGKFWLVLNKTYPALACVDVSFIFHSAFGGNCTLGLQSWYNSKTCYHYEIISSIGIPSIFLRLLNSSSSVKPATCFPIFSSTLNGASRRWS